MRRTKRVFRWRKKVKRIYLIFALAFAFASVSVFPYEPVTHSDMSEEATRRSILNVGESFKKLGLEAKPFDLQVVKFPNSNSLELTILELIRFGADWEDSRGALQALRHFYNPVDGSKLLPVIGETSPDWALEDRGVKDGQPYSYRLMRRNFHKALTESAKSDRDAAWGLTFQTMGHVMHHLQDMAQPQHVRGDAHCDAILPCAFPGTFFGFYSPSVYEKRIEQRLPGFGDYAPVYSTTNTATFAKPRDFWHTNPPGGQSTGKGIAEFTNRSFISAGTNFDDIFDDRDRT